MQHPVLAKVVGCVGTSICNCTIHVRLLQSEHTKMSLKYNFNTKTLIEDERITQSALDNLKEIAASSTNLPHLPDEFFALFLLVGGNEPQLSFKKMLKCFKQRAEAPDIFTNRNIDSEELQKARKVMLCCSFAVPLKNTKIYFMKLQDTNYKNMDYVSILKLGLVLEDLSQNTNPPDEIISVIDLQGINIKHLTVVKADATKKFFQYIHDGFTIKNKAIHFLNCNYVIDKFFSIFKLFLPSELKAVIKTHPKSMSLTQFHREHVPPSCLPKEYGGCLESVDVHVLDSLEGLRRLVPFYETQEKIIAAFHTQ